MGHAEIRNGTGPSRELGVFLDISITTNILRTSGPLRPKFVFSA